MYFSIHDFDRVDGMPATDNISYTRAHKLTNRDTYRGQDKPVAEPYEPSKGQDNVEYTSLAQTKYDCEPTDAILPNRA